MDDLGFCACCGDEVVDRVRTLLTRCPDTEALLADDLFGGESPATAAVTVTYLREILELERYKDPDGVLKRRADDAIERCVLFLSRKKEFAARRLNVSLWDFTRACLGMSDTWAYVLMQYLEHRGLTDHGSGIRCSWLLRDAPDVDCLGREPEWEQMLERLNRL